MPTTTIKPDRGKSSGFPYTLRLADGRTVAVEVPPAMVVKDRGGDVAFTPAGVRFIDRVRVLFLPMRPDPTPGFVRTLRGALGMTQGQFAEAVGIDKMTVFRWEKGSLRPSPASVRRIERLRAKGVRRGVLVRQ